MRRRLLECVLLPLAITVVYSHIQFYFRMNEIFKSKVDREQELNGTIKSVLFGPTLKVICEWMCLLGGRTCLLGMVVPVSVEWMCLFGDNPFRPIGCVYSANGCLFDKVVPVPTE